MLVSGSVYMLYKFEVPDDLESKVFFFIPLEVNFFWSRETTIPISSQTQSCQGGLQRYMFTGVIILPTPTMHY